MTQWMTDDYAHLKTDFYYTPTAKEIVFVLRISDSQINIFYKTGMKVIMDIAQFIRAGYTKVNNTEYFESVFKINDETRAITKYFYDSYELVLTHVKKLKLLNSDKTFNLTIETDQWGKLTDVDVKYDPKTKLFYELLVKNPQVHEEWLSKKKASTNASTLSVPKQGVFVQDDFMLGHGWEDAY